MQVAAQRRLGDGGRAFTEPVTEGWIGQTAPLDFYGVAMRADGTGGDPPRRCGQVAGRRRSAAMAAKAVVPPAGRIAEARRPSRRLREQRERTWRTSMRWSRRIQNGRTRPGADEVVDQLQSPLRGSGDTGATSGRSAPHSDPG